MTKTSIDLDETNRLMGALVRMKPKLHEQMKVAKKADRKKVKDKKQERLGRPAAKTQDCSMSERHIKEPTQEQSSVLLLILQDRHNFCGFKDSNGRQQQCQFVVWHL